MPKTMFLPLTSNVNLKYAWSQYYWENIKLKKKKGEKILEMREGLNCIKFGDCLYTQHMLLV